MKKTEAGIAVYCQGRLEQASKLKVHPESPYRHSEYQVELLTQVVRENGWRNPVVVTARDNATIIKGRLLYEAALANGWKKIPVETQEYATEDEELADMIADNRVTAMSEMDSFLLADTVEKISELGGSLESTGYDQSILDAITGRLDGEINLGGEQEFEINEEEENGIRSLRLIFEDEVYEKFVTMLEKRCVATEKTPSRLIFDLAIEANEQEK